MTDGDIKDTVSTIRGQGPSSASSLSSTIRTARSLNDCGYFAGMFPSSR